MMGMTIMSLLVGVPARLSVQFARTNLVVRAGLASEPDLQRFRRPLYDHLRSRWKMVVLYLFCT